MTKSVNKTKSKNVLLVDATEKEIEHSRKIMPTWIWNNVSDEELLEGANQFSYEPYDMVIIIAHKDEEKRAIEACRHICNKKNAEKIPLFVAVNRYQMNLAHKIKRLPRGEFFFTPINKNTLLNLSKTDLS